MISPEGVPKARQEQKPDLTLYDGDGNEVVASDIKVDYIVPDHVEMAEGKIVEQTEGSPDAAPELMSTEEIEAELVKQEQQLDQTPVKNVTEVDFSQVTVAEAVDSRRNPDNLRSEDAANKELAKTIEEQRRKAA